MWERFEPIQGMKNTKTCKSNIDKYKENKGFPLESMLQTNNDLKQKIYCELMCACLLFYVEGKYTTKPKIQEKMKYRIE